MQLWLPRWHVDPAPVDVVRAVIAVARRAKDVARGSKLPRHRDKAKFDNPMQFITRQTIKIQEVTAEEGRLVDRPFLPNRLWLRASLCNKLLEDLDPGDGVKGTRGGPVQLLWLHRMFRGWLVNWTRRLHSMQSCWIPKLP